MTSMTSLNSNLPDVTLGAQNAPVTTPVDDQPFGPPAKPIKHRESAPAKLHSDHLSQQQEEQQQPEVLGADANSHAQPNHPPLGPTLSAPTKPLLNRNRPMSLNLPEERPNPQAPSRSPTVVRKIPKEPPPAVAAKPGRNRHHKPIRPNSYGPQSPRGSPRSGPKGRPF